MLIILLIISSCIMWQTRSSLCFKLYHIFLLFTTFSRDFSCRGCWSAVFLKIFSHRITSKMTLALSLTLFLCFRTHRHPYIHRNLFLISKFISTTVSDLSQTAGCVTLYLVLMFFFYSNRLFLLAVKHLEVFLNNINS